MLSLTTRKQILKIATSNTPWDTACKFKLERVPQAPMEPELMLIDPGVNFFVLVLEHLGCKTFFSCEGHPNSFYVLFNGTVELADKIERAGWFEVSRHNGRWAIRLCLQRKMDSLNYRSGQHLIPEVFEKLEKERKRLLRSAAKSWQKRFLKST